jgi:adenine-specific DNA-methyltransferase
MKSFEDLKKYYDEVLNMDKSTYKSTNDEPTPIDCISTMISKIPEAFWSKKDLSILDPCCGNGNFHLPIFFKLREHHDTKTILENILEFNDLNESRLQNASNVFCKDTYTLQMSCQNFLEFQTDKKYDLIVANPPYAKLMADGSRASKNHNLIKDFITQSLSLLKPDGFLLFITPDNWMSYADRNILIQKLTEMQIVHLNIHGAKKYFKKIGSSFTWYLIQNCSSYKDIEVSGVWKKHEYTGFVPSKVRKYIPLVYNKIVHDILAKTVDDPDLEKVKVETSSDLHKYTKRELIVATEDDEHPFRLIHTPKQTVWASRAHKYQNDYKVFISTTDKYKVFVDECGMTQSIAFIRCSSKDKATKLMEMLEHPLYVFINNICRWGNFNNIRILQHFPISTTDNPYECFGITEEEQQFIAEN